VSTLDNLRTEAKRWLREVRRQNPGSRKRLRLAYPNAPAEPGLRDVQHALARERGYESWVALKATLGRNTPRAEAATSTPSNHHEARVASFLELACWDHRVHGPGSYARNEAAAMRLLAKDAGIARDSLSTAVVCGDLEEVERMLAARPGLADAKGGARNWEPILYLCYARLPLPAVHDNAVAMARALLDRGANPNAYFMAGGALYSTLVGVAGEGEQDASAHPQCVALYRLLLERGAELYDIQVLYNTHFHGRLRWWLELTYEHAVKTGRADDWKHPDWPMLDMGGYGSGARFCLWTAISKNDVTLAGWLLAHGANPNAAPPSAPRLAKRSLYEEAVRMARPEIAALLARFGATSHPIAQDDEDAFVTAVRRLDGPVGRALVEKHREWLRSTKAIFAAAAGDRVDEVAFLLDVGVPIEIEDEHGQRPLHVAAAHNALAVAALLLDRGAEIDPREQIWDAPPIGFASHHNHRAMIDLLGGVSRIVWILARQGKVERLRDVLRDEPERAREVAPHGVTPLWFLPDDEERAVEVVELFLACGADPAVRLKDGTTAADAARKEGLDRTADVLTAAAAARA
jgi:uncharacterized protein